jgi:hypothetical protein
MLVFGSAFKVTLAMDLGYLFRYVSPVVPCAPNDITRLRENQSKIGELLDDRDVILLDKAYTGFDTESTKANWVIKKKSPRNRLMTPKEKSINQEIESIRRHIEFGFSRVKTRFDIIGRKFRHSRIHLSIL